jgi:hypothetical protein
MAGSSRLKAVSLGDFSMSERIAITFEKVAENEADEELRKKFQEIANAARESL